jgi:hypothetical protein
MLPSKEEQIESILKLVAYKLASEYSPTDKHEVEIDYLFKKIFTVRKQDVLNYLKENYPLQEVVNQNPKSIRDGFYAIPICSGYRTYRQERNIKFDEEIVVSEDEVWSHLVDYLIASNGLSNIVE